MSNKIKLQSSIGELELLDNNTEKIDLKTVTGILRVKSSKGNWIKVKELNKLTNPIQFRFDLDV